MFTHEYVRHNRLIGEIGADFRGVALLDVGIAAYSLGTKKAGQEARPTGTPLQPKDPAGVPWMKGNAI